MSAKNSKGFAVPPPYSKQEWVSFADSRAVPKSKAINHTDGLPAYKASQPADWVHDSVSHGRSAAKGGPQYTAVRHHTTSSGSTRKTLGGTQSLDSIGGHLKKGVSSVNARYKEKVSDRIREGQWHHWVRFEDRWEAAGFVLSQI